MGGPRLEVRSILLVASEILRDAQHRSVNSAVSWSTTMARPIVRNSLVILVDDRLRLITRALKNYGGPIDTIDARACF